MKINTTTSAAAIAALLGVAAGASAAITPKDSSLFPKKFEMLTAAGEVDPAGNIAEWTRSTGGTFSASLSGGALNVNTLGNINNNISWTSATWVALSNPTVGWTVEVSVRVDDTLYDGTANGADRGIQIFAGDNVRGQIISIGKSRTLIGHPSTAVALTQLSTANNADTFHVFRIARDANATVLQVWRDGVQIGVNIGSSFTADQLYFGDGTGNFSSSAAFEYVRWDTTGAYSPPIPEPASAALLTAGAACILRRKRN